MEVKEEAIKEMAMVVVVMEKVDIKEATSVGERKVMVIEVVVNEEAKMVVKTVMEMEAAMEKEMEKVTKVEIWVDMTVVKMDVEQRG